MARETRAQREERLAQENAAFAAQRKAAYTENLAGLLERAIKCGAYTLTVRDGALRLLPTDSDDETRSFSFEYTEASDTELTELEWNVDTVELRQREAERREVARRTALNKLTKEDREALGL